MRSALAFTTVLFAALSGFLMIEVRDTWNTFNSSTVDQVGSSFRTSIRLRAILDAGDIDAAISELDKIETTNTWLLSEIVGEIQSPSWRWGDQTFNLQKADMRLNAK